MGKASSSSWGVSERNRKARFYALTRDENRYETLAGDHFRGGANDVARIT